MGDLRAVLESLPFLSIIRILRVWKLGKQPSKYASEPGKKRPPNDTYAS